MSLMTRGLTERLKAGENIVVAEGYLFEFERRGYLQAGAFVPEVVLDHPDVVRTLHEEFVHAGSDVVEAFTYYGHREKLRIIGREDDLEALNRNALQIARKVADDTGTLMAGNISNTTLYTPNCRTSDEAVESSFKEQVMWAVEGGADFVIAETIPNYGEAKLALEAIQKYGKGVPAVVTLLACPRGLTGDGVAIAEACRRLEDGGAAVVGLNCAMGPTTIEPYMEQIRKTCKGPLACLPVPYRTTEEAPAMQSFKDPQTGKQSFPCDLDQWLCSREHIRDFTRKMVELGVQYMGLCCGNRAFYVREMAETLGRRPPSSKYSADMSKHLSEIGGDENQAFSKKFAAEFFE